MTKHKILYVSIALVAVFSLLGLPSSGALAEAPKIIIVLNDSDSGPGSLRQAVADANPGDAIASNGRSFTIHLASTLIIDKDLSDICCEFTLNGDDQVRIMDVRPGVNVSIRAMTITHGSSDKGGGILNHGNLYFGGGLSYNKASDVGGAIYNAEEGTMGYGGGAVYNSATNGGGAIYNAGHMTMQGALNYNATYGEGGAIENHGTLDIIWTTIAYNTAEVGAGIRNFGILNITNSSFAYNTAVQSGGGLYDTGITKLSNVTISSNSAPNGPGILNDGAATTLVNTIVANNTGDNCLGVIIDGGHNLSWPDATCLYVEEDGTISNSGINADPRLILRESQGGVAIPLALSPDSAAKNRGDDAVCASNAGGPYDQVGTARPQGPHCDIGAFEVSAITVVNDHDCGPGSLRQAIADADPGFSIGFDSPYYTIHLASPLMIDKDLTIGGYVTLSGDDLVRVMEVGPDVTLYMNGVVIIHGASGYGAGILNNGTINGGAGFYENHASHLGGAIYNSETGTIGLGGGFAYNSATDGGGAIYNAGHIVMQGALSYNTTFGEGGAINNLGTLDIVWTTIAFNTAKVGGGIRNSGTFNITNSSITLNTAGQSGGGLYDTATATTKFSNVTISSNSAPQGAGIYSNAAATTLVNTISANNTLNDQTTPGENCLGAIIDGGHNLSWPDATCIHVNEDGTISNNGINADPRLILRETQGALAVPMALAPSSAAINMGDDDVCASNLGGPYDQVGAARPQGSHCDIGASEAGAQQFSSTDGSLIIEVPPGAAKNDEPLSITDDGRGTIIKVQDGPNEKNIKTVSEFTIGPTGSTFNTPITITFHWQDSDNDGRVDGTTLKVENLLLSKDGQVLARCMDGNPACDVGAHTITIQVESLSYFALGASFNEPPVLLTITTPADPNRINNTVDSTATFSDPDPDDTHTAIWDWGDGLTSAGTVNENNATINGSHTYTQAGVYTVNVSITDATEESANITSQQYVVIYDPNGGFVTGGGWINSPVGAYTADPTVSGKATFGFVSKYQKGANVPTGNTEFQFHAANMNFKSTSYDWLVVAGSKAQYKGTGTINGMGEYKFLLTATDGSPDKFRIKIWDKASGEVIYDNQLGALDTADPVTSLQGGSIVIQKAK